MALSRVVSEIFNVEKCRDLKIQVRGHPIKVVRGYGFRLVFYSNFVPSVFEIFDFKNAVTLKTRLGIHQSHWKCHPSIERMHIDVL